MNDLIVTIVPTPYLQELIADSTRLLTKPVVLEEDIQELVGVCEHSKKYAESLKTGEQDRIEQEKERQRVAEEIRSQLYDDANGDPMGLKAFSHLFSEEQLRDLNRRASGRGPTTGGHEELF
jgi:hypothetical protein